MNERALLNTVSQAITRSVDYFLRTQSPQGYWVGELEANATITAEYLFFQRIMNCSRPEREQDLAHQLLAWQTEGGWPLFYGGPPDLNTTLEAATALQMAGLPADAPQMISAAEVVRQLGGVRQARVFTRIWLALLSALSWDLVPAMPPEMMFLPPKVPLNIYSFASWARGTIVPLLIVLAQPPQNDGPVPDLTPFFTGEEPPSSVTSPSGISKTLLTGLFGVLKRGEGWLARNPWRGRALQAARQWVQEHQEVDGGWGGIQPAMVYSTLALSTFPEDRQAVERGLQGIDSFCIQEEGFFRMQSCVSPGWDTPWVMLALQEAGIPPDHPALTQAARWLRAQQNDIFGDWSVAAPGVPAGGWPFEFANRQYPDTDDTALVLLALHNAAQVSPTTLKKNLDWLLGMQSDNGGWGAFDRNNTTTLVEQIPFCDFGEVLDPPSADVSAHILELLGRLGYDGTEPRVAKGLEYLVREQEPDGSWFGRWGVNYIYGTAAALMALQYFDFERKNQVIDKAVDWLHQHQNSDGGWGESCLSYTSEAWRGRGPSTASQTAWAVLALLSSTGIHDSHAMEGIRWLLDHQNGDGTWEEPYFTGTGFPGDFYLKYHEYRNYFPTLALARARSSWSSA